MRKTTNGLFRICSKTAGRDCGSTGETGDQAAMQGSA